MKNWRNIKIGFPFMEVLKWASLVLVILVIVFSFSEKITSKEPFKKVLNGSCKYADMKDMKKGDNQMIKRLYNLDAAEYESVALYYPQTNMGSSELLLVKLKSVDQQDEIKKAAEGRKETQKKNFEGYAEKQYAMVKNSIVDVKGNYILFVSAKNPDKVVRAFENALKGRKV